MKTVSIFISTIVLSLSINSFARIGGGGGGGIIEKTGTTDSTNGGGILLNKEIVYHLGQNNDQKILDQVVEYPFS